MIQPSTFKTKTFSLLWAIAAIGCFAWGVPACTNQEPEFINQSTEEFTPLSEAQLLRWYEAQNGSLKGTPVPTTASATTDAPALDWRLASTTRIGTEHVSLVPFADPTNLFAGSGYHSRRHLLIVQKAQQPPKAAIIEVLAAAEYPAASRALFLDLYRKGKTAAVLPQTTFTGFVFFYTLRYEFRAGRGYVQGRVVPGKPRLVYSGDPTRGKAGEAAGRSGCTYVIISHAPPYAVNVCSGGAGGVGGTGGFGGSNSGGGGNGPPPTDFPELPGNGDDGNDGSGGTAGPAFEYVDPAATFTQGPPPPDVTQYDCGQLQNTHSDDNIQLGVPNTVSGFAAPNVGLTRDQIVGQRGYDNSIPGVSLPRGPSVRYIQDPLNPSVVIDLRHMLVVAYHGSFFGNSVEIMQGLGSLSSAYDHQDYFSNQLGYDFYNQYSNQISANPTAFASFVQRFLLDRTGRSRNTNPDLIRQRCP